MSPAIYIGEGPGLTIDCLFAGGHTWNEDKTLCVACGQKMPIADFGPEVRDGD